MQGVCHKNGYALSRERGYRKKFPVAPFLPSRWRRAYFLELFFEYFLLAFAGGSAFSYFNSLFSISSSRFS